MSQPRRRSDSWLDSPAALEWAKRAVGTAQAKVSADATQATATFRFPARVDGVFAGGRLTKAGWDHSEAKPGEALGIRVEAEEMDGQPVLYEVEREEDGGGDRAR